jgi:hypothetical protein
MVGINRLTARRVYVTTQLASRTPPCVLRAGPRGGLIRLEAARTCRMSMGKLAGPIGGQHSLTLITLTAHGWALRRPMILRIPESGHRGG